MLDKIKNWPNHKISSGISLSIIISYVTYLLIDEIKKLKSVNKKLKKIEKEIRKDEIKLKKAELKARKNNNKAKKKALTA